MVAIVSELRGITVSEKMGVFRQEGYQAKRQNRPTPEKKGNCRLHNDCERWLELNKTSTRRGSEFIGDMKCYRGVSLLASALFLPWS